MFARGGDGAAALVGVLVEGHVGGGVDQAEGGIGGLGDEVLQERAPGGLFRFSRNLDHAHADDGAIGDGDDDCGLRVRGLDDVREREGVGDTGAFQGRRSQSAEVGVEPLGREVAGSTGGGGAVDEKVGSAGGGCAEVGAEGVGDGAFDGFGQGVGAVGFGLQQRFEARVLVEKEGEDSHGQQHGGGGHGGQDGDLPGQRAGPGTAGRGWGAVLHERASRCRVD